MPAARQLIVNADDFGRAPGIVAGVMAARQGGIVTSASLMVRWPAAERAARLALQDAEISVGLHVDLGEWVHGAGEWSAAYEVCDLGDTTAVQAEVERQLSAFRRLVGRDPTHLDSHQHVHREGVPLQVLRRLADRLGVPLRGESPAVGHVGGFYGQTGTGSEIHDNISPKALIGLFDALPPGVTELGCHPGDGSDEVPPYATERRIELETLCDPAVRRALEERNIALTTFSALARDDVMTFELERFVWAAPDRLEVAGVFVGVGDAPLDAPILVVHEGDDTHPLSVVADDHVHPPVDGKRWSAAFSCPEARVAFDLAELHISPDVVIELPGPYVRAPSDPRPALRARRSADAPGPDAAAESRAGGDGPAAADELAAAQEKLVGVGDVIGRARKALLAALAELDESRRRSAADTQRFQEGLAAIRASAEDALALEQETAEEIRERLREAHGRITQSKSEVERLRRAVEEAEDEQARKEAEARSEMDQLGAELEEARENAVRARSRRPWWRRVQH